MQVLCMASNDEQADVTCVTCGQRYAVYYARQLSAERASALAEVHVALARHHAQDATAGAHPARAFNVPHWRGLAHMSAAALLSGAPIRSQFEDDAASDL